MTIPPEYTPEYTPSVGPPNYSRSTRPSEQRLLISNVAGMQFLPSGVYTKSSRKKDIAISLYDQDHSAPIPVYGRAAKLEGTVSLTYRRGEVNKVSIKVEGALKVSSTDWLTDTSNIFTLQSTLYSRGPSSVLPSQMPFHFRLPAQFDVLLGYETMVVPIPPTFQYKTNGYSGASIGSEFQSSVEYNIIVEVELVKALINRRNVLVVPFRYYPRSRPPAPTLLPPATFLETLKVSPEEWVQTSTVIRPRANKLNPDVSSLTPIEVYIALPRGLIYPISSPLPFHIQIQSSPASIALFSPNTLNRIGLCSVRVTFFRKVGVQVFGRESWYPIELGLGKLAAVEPDETFHHNNTQHALDESKKILAWEGQLQVTAEEDVGTFKAGKLYVKDFFRVVLTPDDPASSPFPIHHHAVPVHLVSDHFDSMGMEAASRT